MSKVFFFFLDVETLVVQQTYSPEDGVGRTRVSAQGVPGPGVAGGRSQQC